MQKNTFIIICFLSPIIIFPDLNPIIEVIIAGLLWECKLAFGLLLVSIISVTWIIISLFNFLFSGFRLRHFLHLVLSVGICYSTYKMAKHITLNLYKRPLKLLDHKLKLSIDIQRIWHEYLQIRSEVTSLIETSMKLDRL